MELLKSILTFLLLICVSTAFADNHSTKNNDADHFSILIKAKGLTQKSQYIEAETEYLKIVNTCNDNIVKGRTYIDLANMYFMTGDAEKSLEYAKLASQITEIKDSINLQFEIKYLMANTYLSIGEIDKCRRIFEECRKNYKNVTDSETLSKYFYALGKFDFANNDYIGGIEQLQLASMPYDNEINTSAYGRVLLLVAQMYLIKNDVDLAQKNAEEALTIFSNNNYNVSKIDALCLIGDLYMQRYDYSDALRYYQKAKEVSDTLGAERGKVTANLRLANWYLLKNDLEPALEYAANANATKHTITNSDIWFNTNIMFSRYYLRNNDIPKAFKYADSAKELSKNVKSWSKLSALYRLYGNIYYRTHEFEKSATYLREAELFNDSLNISLSQINSDSLCIKLESKRQENFIRYLKQDNIAKETKIEGNENIINKQKTSIFALIGLFVVFAIAMILLARLFIQKIKDNKELKNTNKRIASQKEEIETQKEKLLSYNRELERLSLIARETDNAIRVFDSEGITTWINVGYTKLYGYSLGDLMMDNTLGFSQKHPIDIKKIIATWNYEKPSIELETEITNKWNVKLWLQTTITPIFNDDDMTIRNLIAIDTNITSLKKTQQEVENLNTEITDSIMYAKRIQEAMLPRFSILTKHYPNSFRLYKPRSIVSGDFYWMTEQNGRIIVACADSTGHGVPGAFLSLIGISFLNKIVNERGIIQPAIILNRLRTNIITHLHQDESLEKAGNGMDMSIISIDKRNNIMEFAGAMTPMYIIRNRKIIELKPDRMPVAYYDGEERAFSSSKVALKPDDQLYMFSDGYYDQFGGSEGLKMKSTKFKETLLDCCLKSNEEQIAILERDFESWRGRYDQIDDILVMGIRI